jgi:hypothetical protein
LLFSEPELRRVIENALDLGMPRDTMLIEEFSDTKDASGTYRKYSMHRFGKRDVFDHIYFSKDWQIKVPAIVDETTIVEELTVVQNIPLIDQVRRVFEIAAIDYGRIDYGVLDGQIQVWEINTNPMLVGRAGRVGARRPVLELIVPQFQTGLVEMLAAPVSAVRSAISMVAGPGGLI